VRPPVFTAPATFLPPPPGEGRGEAVSRGFSLTELLVVTTIIMLLMALGAAGLSAARGSHKKQATQASIAAIDEILQRHFVSCESSRAGAGSDRSLALRKQVTADMPDSWAEVTHLKTLLATEFKSARHAGYAAFLDTVAPTAQYSDAECLFMIVMQGGLADCLSCMALEKVRRGDKDEDGALEFWDEWDEPIRYVLWPGGFELPPGARFFSTGLPFEGVAVTGGAGGTMRPLIFSGGPSQLSSTEIHAGSYLALGNACGDPANATIAALGGLAGATDHRADNITNFDAEVKR
jgi:Tfp pilus assembly protein PilE